jgi:hypothetical protein
MNKLKIFLALMLVCLGVYAANTPTSTIRLAWNAVPPIDSNPITYNIYQGTNSGIYSTNFPTTNTTLSVSNLVRGTTYYFVVTASDVPAGLTSAYSSEVTYMFLKAPATPTGVRAIAP